MRAPLTDRLGAYLGCSPEVMSHGMVIPRVHDLAHAVALGMSLEMNVERVSREVRAAHLEYVVNEALLRPRSTWVTRSPRQHGLWLIQQEVAALSTVEVVVGDLGLEWGRWQPHEHIDFTTNALHERTPELIDEELFRRVRAATESRTTLRRASVLRRWIKRVLEE